MARAKTVEISFLVFREGEPVEYRRGYGRIKEKIAADESALRALLTNHFGPYLGRNEHGNPMFEDREGGGVATVFIGRNIFAEGPCWMR